VYFKTGSQLTALVKEESTRLQQQGVDFIVYVIHSDQSDYDSTLSSGGYVDLVFEGHTHQGYCKTDSYGIYHLQNQGDNQNGLSHVEIAINSVTNDFKVQEAGQISKSKYQNMEDDPIVEELLEKYKDVISDAYATLGYNSAYRSSTALGKIVAELYYKAGVEKWGNQYNIVLGGGSLKTRSPYNLPVGEVTYADLQALFTFDNELRLCSIKGSDLLRRFYNNSGYCIYSPVSAQSINANETYYIIVDTWSSDYAPNNLTTIAKYDAGVFARDLLAEYVKAGGLN
jgi:2',3'-cyclic-nucleotide 2'-phosphodiesterase (5'-nucleotidase family)